MWFVQSHIPLDFLYELLTSSWGFSNILLAIEVEISQVEFTLCFRCFEIKVAKLKDTNLSNL